MSQTPFPRGLVKYSGVTIFAKMFVTFAFFVRPKEQSLYQCLSALEL